MNQELLVKLAAIKLQHLQQEEMRKQASAVDSMLKYAVSMGFINNAVSKGAYAGSKKLAKLPLTNIESIPIKIRSKFIRDLWEDYAAAMIRRRPGSVLPLESFESYLHSPGVNMFIKPGKGAVVGQSVGDIFQASHFAPRGSRGGVSTLKSMSKYDDVVFPVTGDLSSMLERIGFNKLPFGVPAQHRGELVMKDILTSSNTKASLGAVNDAYASRYGDVLQALPGYSDFVKSIQVRKSLANNTNFTDMIENAFGVL